MNDTHQQIVTLIECGKIRISEHGYDEMAEDGISAREAVAGFANGIVVENYPAYPKGPCVLMLQQDGMGNHIHVVWGIPKGTASPAAVIVTAYRPDPQRWTDNFTRKKS